MQAISDIIQKNCDISDARHAREHTLCVYLLKMREYFRWERGYGITEKLPMDELGGWVDRRESRWEALAGEDFACLPLERQCLDPFESPAINATLLPRGLVYSAGIGRFTKPHFFLGKLLHREQRDGFQVLVSGDELARDLSAPPAMLLGGTIFVRRDTLKRMLWEKLEEWRWRRQPDDAMGRCVREYAFDSDPDAALDGLTDQEMEAVILHECGEGKAGEQLDHGWPELLLEVSGSRVEIQARAVRDLLADCLVTLPKLIETGNSASLHFFFANLRAMREALFPALAEAYRRWCDSDDAAELDSLALRGASHWARVAADMLGMPRDTGAERQAISDYVDGQAMT